ncbi:MAG: tetratricopeptide repeat protein [Bacteroides sp.]|nr:tetratricopeptide repeat protein [Bacteroides sp.]
MKKISIILLLLVCISLKTMATESTTGFLPKDSVAAVVTKAVGDSAYMQKDYASAIQVYETLLQQGEAAELYYNLGNSYYKTENLGKAILNYERALLLQPGNSDIRANLEIARAKTVDNVVAIPELFFVTWFKALINCLSADAWAKLGVVLFCLFLLAIVLYLFSNKLMYRKLGFSFGIFLFIAVILINIFALKQKQSLVERNQAVILSPSVVVRSTPSDNGVSLFVLHEGHKVEIKDNSMSSWKEIRLSDGKVGWVPVSSIEVI